MTDLWQYLKTVKKPVVLYGMGNGADKILCVLEALKIPVSGIFASDGFIKNKTFHGMQIQSFSALEEKFGDMVVLLCFGSSRPEVIENIKHIMKRQEIYAPEVPVYGGGLFTSDYAKTHADELSYVYNRLADAQSKKVFRNIIEFKLTGRIPLLFECETPNNKIYGDFFKLTDNESYLDLGAYNGDTVEEFIKNTNGYREITAVEPDIKTFKKLKARTEKYKNIDLINACIGETNGYTLFNMKGGRGSYEGTDGTETPEISVDKITENKNISLIKADVEGNELKMIKGAAETIKRLKPKMRIACYHRTEDMFALPAAVDKIRNDYKIYMRHNPCVPAWDTEFFFV